MQQLLHQQHLGDRTPSQFLRHLHALAGGAVAEGLLRTVWTGGLPIHIQAFIASQPASIPMDQLAAIADKVAEVAQPKATVSKTISEPTNQANLNQALVSQFEKLTARLEKLESKPRPLGRSSSRKRSHSPYPDSSDDDDSMCYYHRNFSDKAKKCRKPYTYVTENAKPQQ